MVNSDWFVWWYAVSVLTAPSCRGPWTAVRNNSEDLYDGGTALFAHPMEDPFVWAGKDGNFHMVFHAFRIPATLKSTVVDYLVTRTVILISLFILE